MASWTSSVLPLPSALATAMSESFVVVKAILVPSGDQAGERLVTVLVVLVNWVTLEPSAFME